MRFGHWLSLILVLVFSLFTMGVNAQAKRVDIIISKVSQKMTVRVDGDIEYEWPVSTGAARYETPSGVFRPFRMEAEHFSKEWDDAPMPHSIFFTGEGHAIHGSFHVKSLGRKASHGCVRLAPENAAVLFDLVQSAGMSNTSISLKGGFFDFSYRPKRSFASIGKDIDKTTGTTAKKKRPNSGFLSLFGNSEANVKKPNVKKVATKKDALKKPVGKKLLVEKAIGKKDAAKKPVAKKLVAQKVAPAKCIAKDPKKPCKKPLVTATADAG
jgi:L,D-transpeptidase catalytic domain